MTKRAYLEAMREKAQAQGDHSQVRALDADLSRLGVLPRRGVPFETTVVVMPEAAVPPKPRRGRPPKHSRPEGAHQ